MNFKSKTVFLNKNIDSNKSFYFFTNSHSGEEALAKLNNKFSKILELQGKVNEYEASLNRIRNTFKNLSNQI